MNKLLYNGELKKLIDERNEIKNLLETTNMELSDERKSLEKLLALKEKEISDKIETIKYYSFITAPVNKYIENLFEHFIGGYDWKVDKNCDNEGNYWICFANYPYCDNPQEFFIRYINRKEYESLNSPECILTDFYKSNDNSEKDIDKLESTIELPSYVDDFMNYVIMWRVDNQKIIIPEENLEEIYNTIIEKYSLDKEQSLKRVK